MTKKIKKQILRYGEWDHPSAPNGKLSVDKSFARKLVDNFKKISFAPVIRGHNEEEAEKDTSLIVSKNIENLMLEDDGVYAEMEINPDELEKYNDVSAAIDMEYTDHETGSFLGPVLRHVAMVVNPYIKGLKPFSEMGESNNLVINLSDIMTKNIKKDQVELDEAAKEEESVNAEESKAEETEETTVEETVEETTEEVVEETVEASEDTVALKAKVEELTAKVDLQEKENKLMKAEKKVLELSEAGKITPAMSGIAKELYLSSSNTVNLSDGSKESIGGLLDKLFEAAPKVIELGEKGINTEIGAKKDVPETLKVQLRERRSSMSDEEFEEWYAKYEKTIIDSHTKYDN